MRPYEQEVRKGIAWLDQEHPGWRAKIDLETLDISSPCNCVLGQTGIGYDRQVRRIASSTSYMTGLLWVIEHGFVCASRTEEWITQIRERDAVLELIESADQLVGV